MVYQQADLKGDVVFFIIWAILFIKFSRYVFVKRAAPTFIAVHTAITMLYGWRGLQLRQITLCLADHFVLL